MVPPRPKASNPESGMDMVTKDETPRRLSWQIPETLQGRHHKSHEEKSRLKHSLMEKSPASSSCKHDGGTPGQQAGGCSSPSMSLCCQDGKGSEKRPHNSKTTEALLVRQHLEKVSAEAINSVMDEILGAHTPADMWQVEKKISTHIYCKRAKAYEALVEQHCSMSDHLTGRDGSGNGSSEVTNAEEDFHKSISNLISTIITEGAKIPGERGCAIDV